MNFEAGKGVRIAAHGELLEFALSRLGREPGIRIEDAYKWLFHATQGAEHAVKDESGVKAWLDEEWETLSEPEPGEALIVQIRHDGAVARLNLRPFKARGGRKEPLLRAFIKSASRYKADKNEFEAVWRMLGCRLESETLGHLTHDEWNRLDSLARQRGFPAIDHSEECLQRCRPAYRVLTGDLAQSLRSDLKQD